MDAPYILLPPRREQPGEISLAIRSLPAAFARLELQGSRIHAIAQVGRRRAVVEDMAEMRVARAAQDLDASHAVRGVSLRSDALLIERLPETRPACAGLEF